MHPDLLPLHAAVNALLRANKAVQRATAASPRANRRGWGTDWFMRESSFTAFEREDDALTLT